jgi:hypothetical protein
VSVSTTIGAGGAAAPAATATAVARARATLSSRSRATRAALIAGRGTTRPVSAGRYWRKRRANRGEAIRQLAGAPAREPEGADRVERGARQAHGERVDREQPARDAQPGAQGVGACRVDAHLGEARGERGRHRGGVGAAPRAP